MGALTKLMEQTENGDNCSVEQRLLIHPRMSHGDEKVLV